MAFCPVIYITLAGCHTKNTVSRLMTALRLTGNISHIFTGKTMGNVRRQLKVKFSHFSRVRCDQKHETFPNNVKALN